jgi:hypothetical protein
MVSGKQRPGAYLAGHAHAPGLAHSPGEPEGEGRWNRSNTRAGPTLTDAFIQGNPPRGQQSNSKLAAITNRDTATSEKLPLFAEMSDRFGLNRA